MTSSAEDVEYVAKNLGPVLRAMHTAALGGSVPAASLVLKYFELAGIPPDKTENDHLSVAQLTDKIRALLPKALAESSTDVTALND